MYTADVVIWADTFRYKKHATINRCRIKSVDGPQWLTVPVLTSGKSKQSISEVRVDSQHHWKHSHLKSMKVSYQNSPYYFFFADRIQELLQQPWQHLNDLDVATLQFLCRMLRIPSEIMSSRQLSHAPDRTQRVLDWAVATNCQEYLVEKDDLPYIDSDRITKSGVNVTLFQFTHPRYHQLFDGFYENLSALDLLFNCGESSKMHIKTATSVKGI